MKAPLVPLSTLGIGSVPFTKVENSCEAIFKHFDIPFWPQYPTRTLRENFVFQFLNFLPGLEVSENSASFDEQKFFSGEIACQKKLGNAFSKKSFLEFEPPLDWALGYSQMRALLEKNAFPEKPIIKLQVTSSGTAYQAFFRERLSQGSAERIKKILFQILTASGLAQIERIHSYSRTPLIFIDEPLRSDDIKELSKMVQNFKNFRALIGLHVCSSSDWEGYEKLPIDVFHFDLAAHPKLEIDQRLFIRTLLKQKRWIAWGIVPTTSVADFRAEDFSLLLIEQVKEISDEDLSAEEILQRSLIAPACGTGTLSPAQDEAVWRSVRLTSQNLRRSYSGLAESKR